MGDARRLLTSYASGYGIDEQERIEARLQAIENQIGMVANRKVATAILDAMARGGVPPTTDPNHFETLTATGAIATGKVASILDGTTNSIVASLAAPSSQDGQLKIITMSNSAHAATVSGTNVDGQSGKTASFSTTAKVLVLMAVGAKWFQVAGNVTWA